MSNYITFWLAGNGKLGGRPKADGAAKGGSKVSMFDKACPMCGSIEWKSVEKDENGVNKVIQCLQCGTQRVRRQPPVDKF